MFSVWKSDLFILPPYPSSQSATLLGRYIKVGTSPIVTILQGEYYSGIEKKRG